MTTPLQGEVPPMVQPQITASAALGALAIMRGTEVGMRWEGAKLGIYFNVPGLIAAITRLATSSTKVDLALVCLGSVVGLFANQYLYISIRRSGRHFRLWNMQAIELETKCPIEGGVKIFTSPGYAKLQKGRMKIQDLLLWITRVCMMVWAVIGVMSLGVALFGGK